jgi:hypothetical protein
MLARPCGLLEPCAATSGTHGSEGAPAQQSSALHDNRLHWVRDVTFDKDRSQVRTGNGPASWPLWNLTISVLRINGVTNIAQALRHHAHGRSWLSGVPQRKHLQRLVSSRPRPLSGLRERSCRRSPPAGGSTPTRR